MKLSYEATADKSDSKFVRQPCNLPEHQALKTARRILNTRRKRAATLLHYCWFPNLGSAYSARSRRLGGRFLREKRSTAEPQRPRRVRREELGRHPTLNKGVVLTFR